MSVTIMDAEGNTFTAVLPYTVMPVKQEQDDECDPAVGDVVQINVDDGMDHDDGHKPTSAPSYGIVCQLKRATVTVAWLYHSSEFPARLRARNTAYYVTDHYDEVSKDAIVDTEPLPEKTAPAVFASKDNGFVATDLAVGTFIACTVTADWRRRNIAFAADVFVDGPGHAKQFWDSWVTWTEHQRDVAMFFAKQMYAFKSPADKLDKCISLFETEFLREDC